MKSGLACGLGAIALIVTGAAWAHHSFAMFDQTKQLPLKGKVVEFQWTNPHAFVHVDVVDADGTSHTWEVELNSPNNLKRQGWKSTSFKPGDEVTVVINPLRDGAKGGLFVYATLPDGKTLGDPTRARGGAINVPTARP